MSPLGGLLGGCSQTFCWVGDGWVLLPSDAFPRPLLVQQGLEGGGA